jgi:hypothetical protein
MVVWTDYMRYRAKLRGFDLERLEFIVNHSTERYYDTETGRLVVVGRHDSSLVIMPYEQNESDVIPVTVHAITREQINFRLNSGRFIYE